MNKKLNNQYTINFDEDYKKLIDTLADAYQRKPAELLRLLLIPILHDKYINLLKDNKALLQAASFEKYK